MGEIIEHLLIDHGWEFHNLLRNMGITSQVKSVPVCRILTIN